MNQLGAIISQSKKASEKKSSDSSKNKHGFNRSYSGARSLKSLPEGHNSLQLYSIGTPNGLKVSIALEEMGVPYDAHTIQILQLDQFTSGFTAINPNGKIPAMVDKEGPEGVPVRIFESGSILLYLADKYNKFIPPNGTSARVECINWIFLQVGGISPMFGQFGHFYKYHPLDNDYPLERYGMEVARHLDLLEKQLNGRDYIIGEYTIADMAIYPWCACLSIGYNSIEYLTEKYG